jgi:hypothetical protein
MGSMADRDKPTDIDKLLAEVDGMIDGGTGTTGKPASRASRASVAPAGADDDEGFGFVARVRSAAVTAVVGGGVVWVLFALLPFLRATSGGIGAFLATFVAVLVLRRRR